MEKDALSPTSKYDFLPGPGLLIHWRLKHNQKTKVNDTNDFCYPLIGFPHKFHNIDIKKQKYSILVVIELRPPVPESSNGSPNFMLPTNSESTNGYPFNLTLITITLCSTTNWESL